MWFRKALAGGLALALALSVCAPGSASKIRLKNEPDRSVAAVDAASDPALCEGREPHNGAARSRRRVFAGAGVHRPAGRKAHRSQALGSAGQDLCHMGRSIRGYCV